jgi:hypothetical protein
MRQDDAKPPQIFQCDEPFGVGEVRQFDRDLRLKREKFAAREAE